MMAKPDDLNDKQTAFCEEYIVDLNATQAAIRSGYSDNCARQIGAENLTKPVIAKYIQKLVAERSERTAVTADRVLAELAKMAFFSMGNVIDDEGNTKPLNQWSKEDLAALQEITETKIGREEESVVTNTKFKVSDKKANLELLGKHLKLFTDKVEHSGGINVTNLTDAELQAIIARGKS